MLEPFLRFFLEPPRSAESPTFSWTFQASRAATSGLEGHHGLGATVDRPENFRTSRVPVPLPALQVLARLYQRRTAKITERPALCLAFPLFT